MAMQQEPMKIGCTFYHINGEFDGSYSMAMTQEPMKIGGTYHRC